MFIEHIADCVNGENSIKILPECVSPSFQYAIGGNWKSQVRRSGDFPRPSIISRGHPSGANVTTLLSLIVSCYIWLIIMFVSTVRLHQSFVSLFWPGAPNKCFPFHKLISHRPLLSITKSKINNCDPIVCAVFKNR